MYPKYSKDAFLYTYNGYSTRSNNFSNVGPHSIHVKNNLMEKSVELVKWTVSTGKLEQDFTKPVIRAGLFNTAKLTPGSSSWSKGDAVQGAVVFKVENSNEFYTLAFEDPYDGSHQAGYKGVVIEGNDPQGAIGQLKGQQPCQAKRAKYYIEEYGGKHRTVLEFVDQ